MPVVHRNPSAGELWLSRPPFTLMAHVLDARPGAQAQIHYNLLDDDGTVLAGPIVERLDESWWHNFQPLERRYG